MISQNFEAVKFVFRIVRSHSDLTGISKRYDDINYQSRDFETDGHDILNMSVSVTHTAKPLIYVGDLAEDYRVTIALDITQSCSKISIYCLRKMDW